MKSFSCVKFKNNFISLKTNNIAAYLMLVQTEITQAVLG